MAENFDIKALKAEREALVEKALTRPFDAAWQQVRDILLSSEPCNPREPLPTVYAGPLRSILLPLPYEVLKAFVERYGQQALDRLFEHAGDSDALLAAYCLHRLCCEDDPRFGEAARRALGRTERIATRYGCFGWEGTLSEYVQEQLEYDSSEISDG